MHAELVAQQAAQLVVDLERLGHVAGGGQGLHQQAMAGFAEGGARHQLPGGALSARELRAAQRQPAAGGPLERLQLERFVLAALVLRPIALLAGQEARPQQLQRRPGMLERSAPRRVAGVRTGRLDRLGGGLHVDPDRRGQGKPQLRATVERGRRQGAAKPGQDHAQVGLRVLRRPARPDHVDQRAALGAAVGAGEQVGQQRPGLARGHRGDRVAAVDLEHQRAAQADPGPHGWLGHDSSHSDGARESTSAAAPTRRQRRCNGRGRTTRTDAHPDTRRPALLVSAADSEDKAHDGAVARCAAAGPDVASSPRLLS